MRNLSILIFLFTLPSTAICQEPALPAQSELLPPLGPVENGFGIVNGPDHAYIIQAPKGWVLDNQIFAEKKIFAVFYEVGKEIDQCPIIAYSMVQARAPGTIEDHIKADMVYSKKGSKSAKAVRQPDLKTNDGRKAIVYTLKGVPGQDQEWMAYIDAPTVVIVVSVCVRDPKVFNQGH